MDQHAWGGPARQETQGASLLFDISGFTALCERYSRAGPQGVEHLTDLLKRHFGALMDTILSHGGDVVSFGGDAMIVVWEDDDLPRAARRAVSCAMDLQRRMASLGELQEERLALKVAVDCGPLEFMYIGGVLGRWESVLTGKALERICSPDLSLVPRSVTLAPGVEKLLGDGTELSAREDGWFELVSWPGAPPPQPTPEPEVDDAQSARVKGFLQRSIRVRLDEGQSGWLGELREITAVFISFVDPEIQGDLQATHTLLASIQRAIYRYEGSLYQSFVDSKGASVIAAFGLPLLSHEDDGTRAVLAALAVQDAVQAAGVECSIGVATGVVFSGVVGSPQRRLYALLGDAMNLSARLMQHANNGILCDQRTRQAAEARVAFEPSTSIAVRGLPGRFEVSAPHRQRDDTARVQATTAVGREDEKAQLSELLARVQEEGGTHLALVEGEAGIGKSTLVRDVVQAAKSEGVRVDMGLADPIEGYTPWFVWRPVFAELEDKLRSLDADGVGPALSNLGIAEEDAVFAPLLNPFLSVELPENDLTSQMSGDARGETTHRLVVQLLQARSAEGPQLLVLEDAHWFDSASAQLMLHVAKHVDNLVMLVTSRPLVDEKGQLRTALLELPCAPRHIKLAGLSGAQTLELLAGRLKVDSLPHEVGALIQERSEGNPLYAEELAYDLVESGVLEVDGDGGCRLVDGADLAATLPRTLQGILRARIDRVQPDVQLTLKVASVIGREFDFPALNGIYPVEELQPRLAKHVDKLTRLEFTSELRPSPAPRYWFRNAMTRDVAYNLMLFSQRRELHKRLARWLEYRHSEDVQALPLLAHHWTLAEDSGKAIHYNLGAARNALDSYANREAIAFLDAVARLEEDGGIEPTAEEQADREEIRGEALMHLGRYGDSIAHYEKALSLRGAPVPKGGAGVAGQLIGELLSHVWSRLRGAKTRTGPEADRIRRIAAVRDNLIKLYFFGQQIGQGLYSMFRQLNEANTAGPSPELARALGSAGAFFSVLGAPGLAKHYNDRAEDLLGGFDHLATKGTVRHVLCFQYLFAADWEGAERSLVESNRHFSQLGASHTEAALHPQVNLGIVHIHKGELAKAATVLDMVIELAEASNNLVSQIQAHAFVAEVHLRRSQLPRAIHHAQRAVDLIGDQEFPAEKLVALSVLALASQRTGQADQARAATEALRPLLAYNRGTPYTQCWGFTNALDTLATYAESGGLDGANKELARAHKALAGFAGVFAFGRPKQLRAAAVQARLAGKASEAERCARESAEVAGELAMPFERALALQELARSVDDETHRQQAEEEAARLLSTMGLVASIGAA